MGCTRSLSTNLLYSFPTGFSYLLLPVGLFFMTSHEYNQFNKFRTSFKAYCLEALQQFGEEYIPPSFSPKNSKSLLKMSIKKSLDVSYDIETPIVYNHSLDSIEEKDEICLILVGDNPGKEEQRHINQRYLVGQAGHIAEGFFAKRRELKIDFRKNVIILNKTILHTPKTANLKKLLKEDENIESFFIKDQIWQAKLALSLQKIFNSPLWIVGYSELGENGLFKYYANTIKTESNKNAKQNIFLYQHFSMNCFIKQLKTNYDENLSLAENLKMIGTDNRKRILMF